MSTTPSNRMFLTLEKLQTRTRQLEAFRFVDLTPITPLTAMPGGQDPNAVNIDVPETISGQSVNLMDEFSGRDRYLWARKTLTLPPPRAGHEVYGLFNFGDTGGGHNSGFESLLYVDRAPYQGVDTNHMDVNLQPHAGKTAELTFLLWTGLEGGGKRTEFQHRIRQAHIGYLHTATDTFYYYSKAITKTLVLLPDTAPEKHALTAALDAAYLEINWDEDKFHATIPAALASLEAKLAKMEKNSPITVSAIGHTHIDVAWLWRLKHTREKSVRSFSTVLRLMEEFDEYLFLQSQPQLYQYVQQDAPALYEKIKQRVDEGRWETDGGMWVEADCNISSGEALVRQLTQGTAFFKQQFGKQCEFLWLPDVFGYSWALPQILKLCRINTFATTKISWNQYNVMPNDLFQWRGIDGSEVLTYFITTPEIGHEIDSQFASYNGMISPRTALGSWRKFRDKNLSQEVLVSYGYGDGGGGVNRNMLKMRRAMDQLPGLPNVKPSKAGDFFRRMHENIETTDEYVHTWDGELYLEYHRGTYTSQANNKKMNRELEYTTARCEWLSSHRFVQEGHYDAAPLHNAWETILLHQFHDIIPGSSIREVYEDSDLAYAKTANTLAELETHTIETLTQPTPNMYTLWHAGSFPRKETVQIPETRAGKFTTPDGQPLPAQKTEQGWLVRVDLQALSLLTLRFTPGDAPAAPCVFTADLQTRTLETPLYIIRWNEQNNLTSLWDKTANREIIPAGTHANAFEIYEDKPLAFDNWDIDIFHTQKMQPMRATTPAQLIECGSERALIRFSHEYNLSTLTQDMIVYRENPRIDFVTNVNWHESNRLLKTAFPLDLRTTKATYDIQFGHVERPTHFNTSWDYARFEVVGHKWADVSEPDYGVSLLNDCKYGYSVKDNVMRLSLLKSGKHPDTQADMGNHTFTYALLPHIGALTTGATIEQGIALNNPILTQRGAKNANTKTLFTLENDAVIVDAVKKAEKEDCLILRIHECRGTHRTLAIASQYNITAYAPCNLLEEDLAPPTKANQIKTPIKPFEIQTYKVWFAK